ncbi:MAG: hypothetical protein LAQ69_36145 [Acidobacteriia bacterium]|nr:hypothetical protein [Terriglobia bacterium]
MKHLAYRYFKVFVLGTSLTVAASSAQERDHNAQQSRRYEDKAHKDFHEWNDNEDRAYRQYLQEHHKKYHDFAKANRKEQNDYWNWRHGHPDNDRH